VNTLETMKKPSYYKLISGPWGTKPFLTFQGGPEFLHGPGRERG